ncbi:MAG TPA: DmsE family decaheme c-type cytochrome [Candidatus Sulfotelmatobacter sp.]|jgi:DmsE family decaheme c-type cytochrome|nr:DmsE family decaheme c-type cytochrome [Candidatus Sulfotelmatobacter sp.]
MKIRLSCWLLASLLLGFWGEVQAAENLMTFSPPVNWSLPKAGVAGPQQSAELPPDEEPAPPVPAARLEQWTESTKTCLKCHDDTHTKAILVTPHGVKGDARTPFGEGKHSCESCHGPSLEHSNATVAKGQKRPPVAVVFKGEFISSPEERNKICAGCHAGGQHINWPGSQHQANDVVCSDCHAAHAVKDPVLSKKTQPEICFGCHAEQRAESYLVSHHPIREGKVACSDCHNPHGSPTDKLLKEFTLNETCYGCHAEQRGPYLWEHEPVREDCSTCHQSHGSTQSHLLKLREPFLCQTCHQSSRSSHEGMVSGALQLPGGSGRGSYNLLLGQGCANCHSKVHGSNSPSGNELTH